MTNSTVTSAARGGSRRRDSRALRNAQRAQELFEPVVSADTRLLQKLVEHGDLVIVLQRAESPSELVRWPLGASILRQLLGAIHLVALANAGRELPQMEDDLLMDVNRITSTLPKRQRQVLEGLKAGRSEKEIAETLHISSHTVHIYIKALYRRFEVTSRAELLALWIRPDG